jgi:Ala-tRNA(Pro) deacylase
MPATPQELFARLDELEIPSRTWRHPPLRTVEESRALRGEIPGIHCKNLLFKDKKGVFWLVVCREDRQIDIRTLERALGAARLSFARPEVLAELLGVTPGAVTPFGLINDRERRVRVVLDRGLLGAEPVNYHPLENTATTQIKSGDLLRFIAACGHVPQLVDFDALAAPSAHLA